MPAKDIFHDCVKHALIKDGWIVTDDPLSLKIGKKDLFIDLAAEKILIAEKGTEKIAVEIKSFVGTSEVEDLKNALGIDAREIPGSFDAYSIDTPLGKAIRVYTVPTASSPSTRSGPPPEIAQNYGQGIITP